MILNLLKSCLFVLFLCFLTPYKSIHAFHLPDISGWWLSTGGTAGMNGKHLIYGGEATLLRIEGKSMVMFGMVADFVHDNRLKSNRMMIGPEIATLFCGVDGGLVLNFRNGHTYKGFSIRPFVAFPYFVSPVAYYRYTRLVTGSFGKNNHEFGIQVKLALPMSGL